MANPASAPSPVRLYLSESSSTTPTASQRDGNSPSINSAVTSLNSVIADGEAPHLALPVVATAANVVAIQIQPLPAVISSRGLKERRLCSLIVINVGLVAAGIILGAIIGSDRGETGSGIAFGAAAGTIAAALLDLIAYCACRNRRNQILPQN